MFVVRILMALSHIPWKIFQKNLFFLSDDEEKAEFFAALGSGSAAEVPEKLNDDNASKKKDTAVVSLHKVSESNGILAKYLKKKVKKIASGTIQQDMLSTEVSKN